MQKLVSAPALTGFAILNGALGLVILMALIGVNLYWGLAVLLVAPPAARHPRSAA